MKNGHLKNSITYLFLALFLSMKLVGLHVLTHSDDKDYAAHCVVCNHAIAYNLTPINTPDLQYFLIENAEFIVQKEIVNPYRFTVSNTIAPNQLFSRPPPF